MNTYEIKFSHTDGTIRTVKIEAYNEERARMRFHVNWDKEMKIIKVLILVMSVFFRKL